MTSRHPIGAPETLMPQLTGEDILEAQGEALLARILREAQARPDELLVWDLKRSKRGVLVTASRYEDGAPPDCQGSEVSHTIEVSHRQMFEEGEERALTTAVTAIAHRLSNIAR